MTTIVQQMHWESPCVWWCRGQVVDVDANVNLFLLT